MNSKLITMGLVIIGLIQFSFGQGGVGLDNNVNQLAKSIESMSIGKQQSIATFVRIPPRKILGSYHIFDTWENKGVIYVNKEKAYNINNINVNVKENRFESRTSKDSVFAFDTQVLDYVLINDRKFKRVYFDPFRDYKICELIVEEDDYKIFKVYRSDVKKNDPDPLMIKPNGDEFVVNSWYYIKRGEDIERFKLNKKYILELLSNHKKEIESFAKKNKLSWNKVEDFKQMYLKWKTL